VRHQPRATTTAAATVEFFCERDRYNASDRLCSKSHARCAAGQHAPGLLSASTTIRGGE
jgi:hypothetical protein